MTADDMATDVSREDIRGSVASDSTGQSLRHDELFRLMTESVKDYAVFAISPLGRIASWNPGAAELFGYADAEIVGQPASVLYAQEDSLAQAPELAMGAAAAFGCTEEERWHQRSDGSRFWATGILAPLRDREGQLRGFIKICRDKTDWKVAEERARELLSREQEARRHAEQEAARTQVLLAREREARRQAEQTIRLRDDFLATVSHELRTPLNAILGWADILAAPCDPQSEPAAARAGVVHAAEVIRRNARAQRQLIEELLDVSRVISGKLRLDARPLAIAPLIHAALDTVRPTAQVKGVTLVEALAPDAGWVVADADRLQQIVTILLSNAVKFTPASGRVKISLQRSASWVELLVSDTGKGISPEFLPRLFEPFRQVDASAARVHPGLGLGLTIARHLVELHGGTLRAESSGEELGATFVVSLPALPLASVSSESLPEEADDTDELIAGLPAFDGLHLLVVDDERDTAELLALMLQQRGATVAVARSATEALEVLERQRFDVLLSDIGMPHEDGYALIRKLRALPPEQGGRTPAVALTAYAREQDRVRAMVAGFQNHITKPVRPAVLFAVVADLAGRLGARSAN